MTSPTSSPFQIWDLEGRDDAVEVGTMWDSDLPGTLCAVVVEHGATDDSVGYPAVLSGNPAAGYGDADFLWRWAVTASTVALQLSREDQTNLMAGPPPPTPRQLKVIANGRALVSHTYPIGGDITVTITTDEVAVAILARGRASDIRLIDRTEHWWPRVAQPRRRNLRDSSPRR